MDKKEIIISGNTYLGIELGSTRIKAVLIDEQFEVISSGEFLWENKLENGYWTYDDKDFVIGLRSCYSDLVANTRERYGVGIKSVKAIGVSGMMHGYLAFDKDFNLLVPFRTWRNTTTGAAADELSSYFCFNIPQRWSIAHLYQAILDNEPHIPKVAHITTLAGYIHYLLTGKFEVGIGEASGIFPVSGNSYNNIMLEKFSDLLKKSGSSINIDELLPTVRSAGYTGAYLTDDGVRLLDESGDLSAGIPMCPPEGDAGTGMVATNCIKPGTGSISAGTSVFSMVVLDKPLKDYYSEIDVVTTPDGSDVAMIHCNNGCYELDQWVGMFDEFAKMTGNNINKSELYSLLYGNSLNGSPDCSGVLAYNFLASEPVVGADTGRIAYFKESGSVFNLANFFRAQLYSSIAALRIGNEILFNKEGVVPEYFLAHGGLFKVQGVAQKYVADAFNTPAAVMSTAGEGGPWGMAVLASYMLCNDGKSLVDYLDNVVFKDVEKNVIYPDEAGVQGFERFIDTYRKGLAIFKNLD